MTKAGRRLSIAALLLMAAQSALGRAFPGAYRDPAWVQATWIGNDWLTLLAASPMLGMAIVSPRARQGARVVGFGVLAYAVYNYTFYLFGARLNVFFPLYVLAVLAAGAALIAEMVPELGRQGQAAPGNRLAASSSWSGSFWPSSGSPSGPHMSSRAVRPPLKRRPSRS